MTKLPKLEELGRIDYSIASPPVGYHCGKCGLHGVKLWRRYQTFLDNQSLLCAKCACAEQSKDGKVYSIVDRPGAPGKVSVQTLPDPNGIGPYGDQIGWRIPAVPTEDGRTYWGYTSVPDDGCQWWYRLPLSKETP